MHVHAVLLFCAIFQRSKVQGSIAAISSNLNYIENNDVTSEREPVHSNTLQFKKQTNSNIRWFNATPLVDTARLDTTMSDILQKLTSKLLIMYNNLFNIYSKRTTAIAGHIQTTNLKLNKLEQDLNNLCRDLSQKYKSSRPDIKPAVKILLNKALAERDKLNKKKIFQYRLLNCGGIMGTSCRTDQDCYIHGCSLLCKTSGYLWWKKSICR